MDVVSPIKVGSMVYRVSFDRAELATALQEAGTDCSGATNHQKLRIVIDPELAPGQRRHTLLHEVEHAICHIAGISDRDKLTEHEYIYRTTDVRLCVLRDNPGLVAYLVEGTGGEDAREGEHES